MDTTTGARDIRKVILLKDKGSADLASVQKFGITTQSKVDARTDVPWDVQHAHKETIPTASLAKTGLFDMETPA